MSLEECLKRIRNSPSPVNERTAEHQAIVPVLEELGWNNGDTGELLFGHKVGSGKGYHADIAFKHLGQVVGLLDVARVGTIFDYDPGPMLDIATQAEVGICILTTGIEWHLFLPSKHGTFDTRPSLKADIETDSIEHLKDKFQDNLHRARVLSRGKDTDEHRLQHTNLTKLTVRREMPTVLNAIFLESEDELLDLIAKHFRNKFQVEPMRAQVSKELKDYIIKQIAFDPSLPKTNATIERPYNLRQSRKIRFTPIPSHITFWSVRYPIRYHKDILVIVAERLYEKNPSKFYDAMHLGGRTVPYVTTKPDDVRKYFRLKSSEFYIHCNLSAEGIHARAQELLDFFGYKKSVLKLEYEE